MNDFQQALRRLKSGERLAMPHGLALHSHHDLLEIGALADGVSRSRHGDVILFSEHRYLRITAGRESRDTKALVAHALAEAEELVLPTTTELRLLTIPGEALPFSAVLAATRELKARFPQLHIRLLSAFQLLRYANAQGTSVGKLAEALAAAGASSIDGRGAGLFGFSLGPQAGRKAIPADTWLAVHREVHAAGLKSEATMAYGHGETPHQRLEHLDRLRSLQDETQGFLSFQALANQFQITTHNYSRSTPSIDDLRIIAVARLYLDNFPNIGAGWGRIGNDLAQIALNFGANDLEGSLTHERNSRLAAAHPFRAMNRNELISLVNKTGRCPAERDGLFQVVKRSACDKAGDAQAAESLLYKGGNGVSLSSEEVLSLAQNAPLLPLGQLAGEIARSNIGTKPALLGPVVALGLNEAGQIFILAGDTPPSKTEKTLLLDLGKHASLAQLPLSALYEQCLALRQANPEWELVVAGLKGLWGLARHNQRSLEEVLALFRDLGVVSVMSSLSESEDDLTVSEVVQTHRLIHAADMASSGKVELAAPYNGTDAPFWEPFVERLAAFEALQKETGGLLAVSVEHAKGAFISPAEYLRALALARIQLRSVPAIAAPFQRLPSLMRQDTRSTPQILRTALKLSPLCFYFGAGLLGAFATDSLNGKLLEEELNRIGLGLWFCNSRGYERRH